MSFKGKKILIGITGGIAAYKTASLIRLFKKDNAEVKVVMTYEATQFITPLTISVLSENLVNIEPYKQETGSWNSHIELANWADVYIIAPATANTIAKMANGISDNLLLTTYLSAKCPVFFAPAMDLDMYAHKTTQENIKTLQKHDHYFLEPEDGELASGLHGPGRMQEPKDIYEAVKNLFIKKKTSTIKKS